MRLYVPCIRSDLLVCVYRRVKELEEALSQTKATNQATQLENDQLKVRTTSPMLFTLSSPRLNSKCSHSSHAGQAA